MTAPRTNHRESADNYAEEICRAETAAGAFRVIVCRDAVQWIIQRLTCASATAAAARWTAESFVTSREALTRLWQARTGTPTPAEILALPHRFIRGAHATKS